MSKLKISLLILTLCITTGCSFGVNKSEKIYKAIFKNMKTAVIHKKLFEGIGDLKFYRAIISDVDMDIIKKEMKDIKDIKEDYATFGGYKKGYRGLFIDDNPNTITYLVVLYSIEERTFVVRECDVYPKRKAEFPKIKVYTLKMPDKVAEILEKYEQTLPAKGRYESTWPLDS